SNTNALLLRRGRNPAPPHERRLATAAGYCGANAPPPTPVATGSAPRRSVPVLVRRSASATSPAHPLARHAPHEFQGEGRLAPNRSSGCVLWQVCSLGG